ncbi:MAG TPA: hypothetical protein VMA83_06010 [Solirubrobacteraceae bacterium]|nr:hypothetical protein [Solirubrobacteraceae bacterium]
MVEGDAEGEVDPLANVSTGGAAGIEVPPIEHDSNQMVAVRRGELRDWAAEVERVLRTPIEAPGLWKSAGIGLSVAAVFFGLGLLVTYTAKEAPSPSAWAVVPALALFLIGVAIFKFTEQVDKQAKAAGYERAKVLADKIRQADVRTPRGRGDGT